MIESVRKTIYITPYSLSNRTALVKEALISLIFVTEYSCEVFTVDEEGDAVRSAAGSDCVGHS